MTDRVEQIMEIFLASYINHADARKDIERILQEHRNEALEEAIEESYKVYSTSESIMKIRALAKQEQLYGSPFPLKGGTQTMLWPDDVDKEFNWPPGRARRLAKQGKLPFYRLPDGSIRFKIQEVERLVKHVTPPPLPQVKMEFNRIVAHDLCTQLGNAKRQLEIACKRIAAWEDTPEFKKRPWQDIQSEIVAESKEPKG